VKTQSLLSTIAGAAGGGGAGAAQPAIRAAPAIVDSSDCVFTATPENPRI
jgi:hypothetical protein